MKDYYYDVEVCTSRPVSSDDVINILEALEEYFAVASHKENGDRVELSMTVTTEGDEVYARYTATEEVRNAFFEEMGRGVIKDIDVVLVETEENNDPVNHPAHYTWLPVEPIEIIEHLTYNRGAACKYLIRAGLKSKDTEVEDLEKSLWYIQREIERVKNART